ncbi:MAG: carbohydrate ABC transporter permease [Cellulosilyticaceae bacterium]
METKQVSNKIKKDASEWFIQILSYGVVGLFTFLCVIPFILLVSASFTSEASIMEYGFRIIPKEISFFAYKLIFENPNQIIGSYILTILVTIIGTIIGLMLISMTGYALQRSDFEFRNKISFYIYFTTLFSGGLVPFYLLMTKHLGLKDSYLAILLPALMSPWLIILMKNFIKSIPHSITESAKIDGAGDFQIFIHIILPMIKPALATIGLFLALSYWNEWYNSMLFLTSNVEYKPLQLFLYNIINKADYIRNSAASSNVPPQDIPLESMKMATAVVATGPVILFYPFVQKYFIQGITVGAVKG